MKFFVDLWLDGYDTEEECNEACKVFIDEQLDMTASGVDCYDLPANFSTERLDKLEQLAIKTEEFLAEISALRQSAMEQELATLIKELKNES